MWNIFNPAEVNTPHTETGNFFQRIREILAERHPGIPNEPVFKPIIRLDFAGGQAIPPSANDFQTFADDCRDIVQAMVNDGNINMSHIEGFIIGNEPNMCWENQQGNNGGGGNGCGPEDEGSGVPAENYGDCFKICRSTMQQAHSSVKVYVAGPGLWNRQGAIWDAGQNAYVAAYHDNYFQRVIDRVGSECDGYALHTYGRYGGNDQDGSLEILETERFANSNQFHAFELFLHLLVRQYKRNGWNLGNKDIHITETNTLGRGGARPGDSYDDENDWMQNAYREIHCWNQCSDRPTIKSLCWFVYHYNNDNEHNNDNQWADFSLTQLTEARSDYNSLTQNGPAGCFDGVLENVQVDAQEIYRSCTIEGNNVTVGADGDLVLEGCYIQLQNFTMNETSGFHAYATACYSKTSKMADGETEAVEESISYDEEQVVIVYPNPFRDAFHVDYTLREATTVTMIVYNLLGQEVSRPIAGKYREAGPHQQSIEAERLPTGTYIYTLTIGEEQHTGKVIKTTH